VGYQSSYPRLYAGIWSGSCSPPRFQAVRILAVLNDEAGNGKTSNGCLVLGSAVGLQTAIGYKCDGG
jgi:hypothetical protein